MFQSMRALFRTVYVIFPVMGLVTLVIAEYLRYQYMHGAEGLGSEVDVVYIVALTLSIFSQMLKHRLLEEEDVDTEQHDM